MTAKAVNFAGMPLAAYQQNKKSPEGLFTLPRQLE
jgi:hypothetical protein